MKNTNALNNNEMMNDTNLSEMLQAVAAGNGKAMVEMLNLVDDQVRKIAANGYKKYGKLLGFNHEEMYTVVRNDLLMYLTAKDARAIREFKGLTLEKWQHYCSRLAYTLLLKQVEYATKDSTVYVDGLGEGEYDDDAAGYGKDYGYCEPVDDYSEAEPSREQLHKALHTLYTCDLAPQQARVMLALLEAGDDHVQQQVLAAQLGMTPGQFNKNKCDAQARLNKLYGHLGTEELLEIAAEKQARYDHNRRHNNGGDDQAAV